jgi:hypothetical protein
LKENLRATNCLSSCWGRALDCGLQFIDDFDGHYADSDRVDANERCKHGADDRSNGHCSAIGHVRLLFGRYAG